MTVATRLNDRSIDAGCFADSWSDTTGQTTVALQISDGIPLLRIEGPISHTTAHPARSGMGAALRSRPGAIVVDVTGVAEINRTAIVLLAAMRRHSARHGTRFALCGLTSEATSILWKLGLAPLFDIRPTASMALSVIESRRRNGPFCPQ